MLFNSTDFFVFFIIVFLVNFCLAQRFRLIFLLCASLYYYASFDWHFLFLLLFQGGVGFVSGHILSRIENQRGRKSVVLYSALILMGLLGYYKYYNFFNDSFRKVFESLNMTYVIPHLNILLPVGISFYSFQIFGYVCDVYRKVCPVEKRPVNFFLFASFFSQLAAGPIGRAPELLPQFDKLTHFSINNIASGGGMFLWGLFKKIVIADRLALYVNAVYAAPESYSGTSLLLATYFFTFQIYCDFSGYSDMAIGTAKILGYDLKQNFNLPYFACNISDFWKRWHISLSTWFRDYLYIPLGGNRVSYRRHIANIFIVFAVSGLWHGASWTFVVWGALHGVYNLFYTIFRKRFHYNVWSWGGIFVTFNAVAFAWIFFRASSLESACSVVSGIFKMQSGLFYLGSSQITTVLSFLLLCMLIVCDFCIYRGWFSNYFSASRMPIWLRVIGYSILASLTALFGISSSTFIYLQF